MITKQEAINLATCVGGKILTEEDLLKREDIMQDLPVDFWNSNKSFYGIS